MSHGGVGFLILVCGGVVLFVFLWFRPVSPSLVFERVDTPGLVEIVPGFDLFRGMGRSRALSRRPNTSAGM
jgi:hypothetical protein